MKPVTPEEMARIVGGEFISGDKAPASDSSPISGFALDNREVKPGDLFIAIKGERVDGHDFAAQAIQAGAAATLAERPVDGPYILVDNVVETLAKLGRHYRDQFHGPVIGITGSAGKTTTKEFLAAALAPKGSVLKAEGNRNTEYTSPLLWTELADEWAAVVEMGMRGFGQIAHLAAISRPTIGLITNIGWSHAELVGSREGVAKAKAELLEALPDGGPAVLWEEDEFLHALRQACRGVAYTFGWSAPATCRVTGYRALSWFRCEVSGTLDMEASGNSKAAPTRVSALPVKWKTELPAVGRHIALNAAAAILAAALAGVGPVQAAEALKNAKLPPLRMEIRSINGGTVVLDTYNAAPNSVIAALETLAEVPCEGRRLAALGEMRELGSESQKGHEQVGAYLAQAKVERAIFYGATSEWMRDAAIAAGMAADSLSIASSLEDVTDFIEQIQPGDAMLIKGSRSLELERALEPLEEVG